MAIYRNIHTTFWTDTKIADEFTPEDKYFVLYCLTNSYTNLCRLLRNKYKTNVNRYWLYQRNNRKIIRKI